MREQWKRKKVADLVEPLTTIDPRKEPGKNFTYIDVSSVSRSACKIDATTLVKGSDAPSRARRLVKAGDVIFATIRPTLQRIAEIPNSLDGAVCSTGYFVLRPKPEILSKFLFYSLFAPEFFYAMAALQRGAAYPAVSDGDVKGQELFIPPLPEQKRIVTILDDAFEEIDTVVANTENNLANARELFDSYLNSVFSQRGEGWVEMRLEEIVSSTQIGLVRNRKEQGENLEHGYVKMDNITPYNRFDGKNIVRVEADKPEVEKYRLKKDDLLFNTRNSYELVGKSCLYDIDKEEPVLFNNNIMRIRFVGEIYPNFAAYLFYSPKVKKQLESMKSGTTNVSAIYYKSLKDIRLAFPSLDTQKTICRRLDEMSARTQKLEAIYQQKLTALAELKQSLLHKAFSGELTVERAESAVEEATA
ncbi:restriction endonuclease subunit S [Halomonas aquatica]|uniref:Restriction endonuclease subunit S n=1 Tax=Halomonas aquatica TaxID=3151123 RepID=A0ABV1NGP6_9GAMM